MILVMRAARVRVKGMSVVGWSGQARTAWQTLRADLAWGRVGLGWVVGVVWVVIGDMERVWRVMLWRQAQVVFGEEPVEVVEVGECWVDEGEVGEEEVVEE